MIARYAADLRSAASDAGPAANRAGHQSETDRRRSSNARSGPTLFGVQGSVAHPAGNYARVIEAARLDLEASGAPSFVAATVTASWQVRTAPLVFASVASCQSQAQAAAGLLEPGELVVIVSRQVRGDRQTFCVMTPDTLATIHRSTEVIEPRIHEPYLTL